MSYALSPRPVCSMTIGTRPFTDLVDAGPPLCRLTALCNDAEAERASAAAARRSIVGELFTASTLLLRCGDMFVACFARCCVWCVSLAGTRHASNATFAMTDAPKEMKRGFSDDVSLESLRAEVADFAEERDWNQVSRRTSLRRHAASPCPPDCSSCLPRQAAGASHTIFIRRGFSLHSFPVCVNSSTRLETSSLRSWGRLARSASCFSGEGSASRAWKAREEHSRASQRHRKFSSPAAAPAHRQAQAEHCAH